MGRLFVGTERNGFEASDEIVVTIAAALDASAAIYGYGALAAGFTPEMRHQRGRDAHHAIYNPRVEGFDVLRTQLDRQGVQVDSEYAERAHQCIEATKGTLVLDDDDQVVTDPADVMDVITRALGQ